jgi:hypothetical protein
MRNAVFATALAALLTPAAARAADKADIDQAVEAGVSALRQFQTADGSWSYGSGGTRAGATALAALTLLECGATKDDRQIVAAANYIREESTVLRHTYSIALALIFLDRLGDSADVPLIESLAARLVAGQDSSGGWSYFCPEPVQIEQRRLHDLVARRGIADGGNTAPAKGREARDFQQRMRLLNIQGKPGGGLNRPDNSNTQFATLALWVARRHSLPVDNSLRAVERHFRVTQNADGGWSYGELTGGPIATLSTPTMTCAGLLGIAVGFGVANDKAQEKGGTGRNLSKDSALQAALRALSSQIGTPLEKLAGDTAVAARQAPRPGGRRGLGPPDRGGFGGRPIARNRSSGVSGKAFYFLWSLERVAVALNLDTIGKKDWYGWGSDVLIATQSDDGIWGGDYAEGGVDTCFALLFLKRANFASDLSKLTGHVQDPGQALLRAGGVGGGGLNGVPKEEAGVKLEKVIGPVKKPDEQSPASPQQSAPIKSAPTVDAAPSGKLADVLLAMPADKQLAEIERLRDQKGADNTEALATAIPHLSGESRQKARDALADREARMSAKTIGSDLQDENAEIRRAAALACALKEHKQFISQLIALLSDRKPAVSRAAYAALKELSGQDFGPKGDADEPTRKRAISDWQDWWKKQPH